MDNRFPWMLPVKDAPDIPADVRDQLVRIEDAVASRLGYRCAYNKRTGELFVYLKDMELGVTSWPVRRKYGVGTAPKLDDVVATLQSGRMTRRKKSLLAKYAAQAAKSRRARELESWLDDRRSTAIDHAEHVLEKIQMGPRWRKSAVVSGSKE